MGHTSFRNLWHRDGQYAKYARSLRGRSVMDHREALRAAVRGLAPDAPVTVPAAWVRTLLLTAPDPAVAVDLPGARVAELLGRDPVTVAAWCRAGLLEGAYRLRGREWRVPAASLEDFQRREGRRS